jgi:hypothetical protein
MGICLDKDKYELTPIDTSVPTATNDTHLSCNSNTSSSNSLSPVQLIQLIPLTASKTIGENICDDNKQCEITEKEKREIRQQYENSIREIYKAEVAKYSHIYTFSK